jgi:outer membrane autotransporter protein
MVCSHREQHDIGIKASNRSTINSLWLKAFSSLLLLYSLCGTLEAGDIRLSNLTQSPSNTVGTLTPVTYSLAVMNVPQGLEPEGINIRVRIGVYRNESLIKADSGEISATGCVADGDYFRCNDLQEEGVQRPTFTWNNPAPGRSYMQFTAFCQRLPLSDEPVSCPSSPYTLSINTIVGQSPNAIANTSNSPIILDAGANDDLGVTFNGTQSTDSDGTIESYEWFEGETVIATGPTPTLNLSAGDHVITLRVTDNDGLSDEDRVTYTIRSDPTANAGPDISLTDTDNDGTENVALDATGSSDPGGSIAAYTWYESDNRIATGATPTVPLSVGTHTITLRIMDNHETTDEDQVVVTILPASETLNANAGPDQQLIDTDNSGEEVVLLDGSASSSPNEIVNYEWFEDDGEGATLIGTGETLSGFSMRVGEHTILLRVTDSNGQSAEDQVVIEILPPQNTPNADAGGDQRLTDSNSDNAEEVRLDGTGSSDPDGSFLSYEWFESDTQIATGATPNITLDVGIHNLTLRVTDSDELTDEDQVVITILPGPHGPTANAGPDQRLTDTNNNNSEEVVLDGSGSSDSNGFIVSYIWLEEGVQIATGATPMVALSVGEHTLTLRVRDNTNFIGEDQVLISVAAAPNSPTANAGEDQTLIDRDADGSVLVNLDASASSDTDGTISSFQWLEDGAQIASGVTATIRLPVGTHTITLQVTDNDDQIGEDQLTITIVAEETTPPVANAGADQSLVDTDGDGSASVPLDGTASVDPNGSIISYTWYEGENEIATGATPTVVLSTGAHTLTLMVTDDTGLTHRDQVTISIGSNNSQLQIVSGNSLTGSSGDTVGPFTVELVDENSAPIVNSSVVWRVIPENAATLSESESTTDQQGQASTSMTIQQTGVIKLLATHNSATVEYVINSIAEKPGLTGNQQAVGSSLDNLCPSLAEKQASDNLTAAEQDLLMTCENLVTEPDAASALSRLTPEEVAAQGTASMEAASTQLANINTRLVALRRGDLGLNLSGLTVNYGGIAFNQQLFEGMFNKAQGGGAGDISELQGRWGAFINGSVNFGEKDETQRESGFDFDTTGVTFGLDYRFNHQFVAGGALGFSRFDSDYNDAAGNLAMDAWSLSAYGTYYKDNNLYVDGLIQIGSNNYDTKRRINAIGAPDQFGQGDTDGTEYAFNLSAGYEYRRDTWTLTPYGRLSYTRAQIDAYSETASNPTVAGIGSVLRIEDQKLKSMVLVIGGNFSYNISTTNAVLMPQLRFEWEHEFEDDSRFINARFINDPTHSEFAIETNESDTDYFNLGLGLSAVFSHGRSAYLFYETRLDQDEVTLNRINAGMRLEF